MLYNMYGARSRIQFYCKHTHTHLYAIILYYIPREFLYTCEFRRKNNRCDCSRYVRRKSDGNNKRACAVLDPPAATATAMGSPGSGTGNSNSHTSSSSHTRGTGIQARTIIPLYRPIAVYGIYTVYIWSCSGAPDFRSGELGWAEVLSSSGHPR